MTSAHRLPRPSATRLAVRVTAEALRGIRSGHPWVYENSILSIKGEGVSGDLAVIFDDDRKFVAIGLYDPDSPIRIKIVHRGKPTTVDRAFWMGKLQTALEFRSKLIERGDTTGYRCINGENDEMPGIVLDHYAGTMVLKIYNAIWVPHLNDLVPAINDVFHPDALVLRHARNVEKALLHGLEEGDALLGTAPTEPVLFREAGLTFEADVIRGQKTGYFLDQRENRVLVGTQAEGAKMLDMFAATGGFTVHAAAGGATEVVAVDISEPTLSVAERNLQHNVSVPNVAACKYRPMVGDAYEVLERLWRNGERFDIVVIDPPSFTPRQTSVDRALASYAILTEKAVRLVKPGGLYVQASCSSRVTADEFHLTVSHAAARAGRPLDEWRRTSHPVDHPIGFPQGAYLKAVFARVP
ncbi:MAG: methyltransferase domain-containing protein [Actinobacteria bacterium]|nr:methyltransferase domain-containing protein [Actinomycetota bacterium]MSW77916.1 methyltransferase domain-containing protein [Actinomycetota bacterium]MSX55487.1 methyltransferase domain-containing protein [Actinomycetota bacterium]MSZ81601.1 methyltransferase domain-containing protein [Actinomycetota bacterium]MTB18004.1 methyltransferase domain-containing protein [Actinomycetota bacterium]